MNYQAQVKYCNLYSGYPPTGPSKPLSFHRYIHICTTTHFHYCYLVLLHDSPPLLLWKLLVSEFHIGCIKRFGKKKDKEKTSGQWKELHPAGRREETALHFVLLVHNALGWSLWSPNGFVAFFLSSQPLAEGAVCLYDISSSGFVLVAGKWPHLQPCASPPLHDKGLSDQSLYLCAQGRVWWGLDAAVLWMLKNLVPYALRHSKELPTQEAPSPTEISSILSKAASFIFSK